MEFRRTQAVLHRACQTHACPAAVCEVGRSDGPLWTHAFGHLTYDADAPETTTATMFDLASLTKVIATTSIALSLVRRGLVTIDTPVASVFESWRGDHRKAVTVGHLLDHSSGLPATLTLLTATRRSEEPMTSLLATPLERRPGEAAVYSDAGFLLLGCVLERLDGRSLAAQWNAMWDGRPNAIANEWLSYTPDLATHGDIAPTEFKASRGGIIRGVVHDDTSAALGGVTAHAGLFGRAGAVGAFAAWVLRSFHKTTWLASPELMRIFAKRRAVRGSSRALGWDTMLPTSSCGTRMSGTAIGHTGFTGTSLWIDWERDLYAVLLTNRIHPSRNNELFLPYRSQFHDALADDMA